VSRPGRLSAALLLCGFGCDPRAGEEGLRQKQSVAHLCWVENRIRSASNPEKSSFLADLSRSPCPTPDACRMRETCVAGYTVHVDALSLTSAAKQLMAEGRDGEAARLLGAAEGKLKEAGPNVEQCTSLSADLRRAYSLD
jgi:hypothetical protein